jgi:hypothetical protein
LVRRLRFFRRRTRFGRRCRLRRLGIYWVANTILIQTNAAHRSLCGALRPVATVTKSLGLLRVATLNLYIPAAPVHPTQRIAQNGRFPCAFCRPEAQRARGKTWLFRQKTSFLTVSRSLCGAFIYVLGARKTCWVTMLLSLDQFSDNL